jgi:hypothetical protein
MHQQQKRRIITAMAVLVAISSAFLISSRIGGQAPVKQSNTVKPDWEQKRKEFQKRFPTARYDEPEEQDLARRAKRQQVGKRYENAGGLVDSTHPIAEDEERILQTEEYESVPALPVKESELIVIGEVLEATAHLSNNKKTVYSEFTVRINEILRDTTGKIKTEGSITMDREGGFVEYINGLRRLHRIAQLTMPRVGGKYILFLRNRDKSPNYEIINGYELNDGGVVNLTASFESFPYFGMDQTVLLSKVRQALSQAAQSRPEKEN